MTQYSQTIENYGPSGLKNTQTVNFTLTGEQEFAYLSGDKLRTFYATLRQWQVDAETESNAWATQTQAQRDAAMATTFHRLGLLMGGMADLLSNLGKTGQ